MRREKPQKNTYTHTHKNTERQLQNSTRGRVTCSTNRCRPRTGTPEELVEMDQAKNITVCLSTIEDGHGTVVTNQENGGGELAGIRKRARTEEQHPCLSSCPSPWTISQVLDLPLLLCDFTRPGKWPLCTPTSTIAEAIVVTASSGLRGTSVTSLEPGQRVSRQPTEKPPRGLCGSSCAVQHFLLDEACPARRLRRLCIHADATAARPAPA